MGEQEDIDLAGRGQSSGESEAGGGQSRGQGGQRRGRGGAGEGDRAGGRAGGRAVGEQGDIDLAGRGQSRGEE